MQEYAHDLLILIVSLIISEVCKFVTFSNFPHPVLDLLCVGTNKPEMLSYQAHWSELLSLLWCLLIFLERYASGLQCMGLWDVYNMV